MAERAKYRHARESSKVASLAEAIRDRLLNFASGRFVQAEFDSPRAGSFWLWSSQFMSVVESVDRYNGQVSAELRRTSKQLSARGDELENE